jgi:hypothetical protein
MEGLRRVIAHIEAPVCLRCGAPAVIFLPAPWGVDAFCDEGCIEAHSEDVAERDAERFYGGGR